MKSLFIDLDICASCPKCVVDCDYFYHPDNNGITHLREKAHFALICRHCEQAPCVNSCPQEALQRNEDKVVVRSNMLCVGCNSCVAACPFGTIYHDIIPFIAFSCDLCVDRCNDRPVCRPTGREPVCVKTCPYGALKYGNFEEDIEKRIYQLKDRLSVHITAWRKDQSSK